jgi:hypothetical protein
MMSRRMISGTWASGLVLTLAIASPVAAQVVEPGDIRKPVLMLKPSLWVPKTTSKSQLRPQLKPAALASSDTGEAYVPPDQVNALPSAAAAPLVQLAAAHASVSPSAHKGSASELPPATIADFAGRYLGAGVEVALAPSAAEPPRRMSEVEISGTASEFTVKWATMKVGANFKPETVKSSQQQFTFRPAGVPGKYVAVAAAGQPAPDATAEMKGRTMIVLVTNALPSGAKSLQRYERTLNDSGMDVVFTRTENGAVVRQVNLSLTKAGGSLWRGL